MNHSGLCSPRASRYRKEFFSFLSYRYQSTRLGHYDEQYENSSRMWYEYPTKLVKLESGLGTEGPDTLYPIRLHQSGSRPFVV